MPIFGVGIGAVFGSGLTTGDAQIAPERRQIVGVEALRDEIRNGADRNGLEVGLMGRKKKEMGENGLNFCFVTDKCGISQ